MTSNLLQLKRLNPKSTIMLVCDIQEVFRKAMPLYDPLIQNTLKLLKGVKLFNIPVLATEQYPEKLGPTVGELNICETACEVIAKTKFSMMVPKVEELMKTIFEKPPQDAILVGLETHVCIEQTCIDLLKSKMNVWVVGDCVCSRLNQDRNLALWRLRHAGCLVASSENILFNLLSDKNNSHFKEISKLVKNPSCDMQIC